MREQGGVKGWTLHDLRRTFSSKCAEWQIASPDLIERLLLGHTTALSPVARAYNRWHYLPQMKAALERYEEKLAQLSCGMPVNSAAMSATGDSWNSTGPGS